MGKFEEMLRHICKKDDQTRIRKLEEDNLKLFEYAEKLDQKI